MKLDLRREFTDVYSYLADRVSHYVPKENDGPGDGGPITMIEVGFEYSQSAWVVVVFDTRPDAEPDGEWNSHIDGQELSREAWLEAAQTLEQEPVTLVQLDGGETVLEPGSELAESLGELLKGVLFKARADGLFRNLPKAYKCEMGVEHQNGAYGWPSYDDRKKENLA